MAALAIVAMITTATAAAQPATAQESPPIEAADLTTSFQWSSTGPLIGPKPDANHPVVAVKDLTVVRCNGQWIVYMTTADGNGAWSMVMTSFSDWSQAGSAPQRFLSDNPNLRGWYTAAPQLFYFAPRDEWYLVYQTGPPSYFVSKNPADPMSWSAPKRRAPTAPAADSGAASAAVRSDLRRMKDTPSSRNSASSRDIHESMVIN
ncbi:non-reducing end alpha-L-arabinofuranosidase family hydrolase [Glycomyces sp. YM15]|uniref:non-reducing end alpha-L-arabinofuranosidase family hydrolase n=1 Tax=Glycomyces sp. YM15 TaxID=2800446 RepID=UPI001964B73B|nr:non-reducing end alpha-L-arabinofuranosidase family hydrolase [Glycomyces sp. YM15]